MSLREAQVGPPPRHATRQDHDEEEHRDGDPGARDAQQRRSAMPGGPRQDGRGQHSRGDGDGHEAHELQERVEQLSARARSPPRDDDPPA